MTNDQGNPKFEKDCERHFSWIRDWNLFWIWSLVIRHLDLDGVGTRDQR
jgi:hypothetical protein